MKLTNNERHEIARGLIREFAEKTRRGIFPRLVFIFTIAVSVGGASASFAHDDETPLWESPPVVSYTERIEALSARLYPKFFSTDSSKYEKHSLDQLFDETREGAQALSDLALKDTLQRDTFLSPLEAEALTRIMDSLAKVTKDGDSFKNALDLLRSTFGDISVSDQLKEQTIYQIGVLCTPEKSEGSTAKRTDLPLICHDQLVPTIAKAFHPRVKFELLGYAYVTFETVCAGRLLCLGNALDALMLAVNPEDTRPTKNVVIGIVALAKHFIKASTDAGQRDYMASMATGKLAALKKAAKFRDSDGPHVLKLIDDGIAKLKASRQP